MVHLIGGLNQYVLMDIIITHHFRSTEKRQQRGILTDSIIDSQPITGTLHPSLHTELIKLKMDHLKTNLCCEQVLYNQQGTSQFVQQVLHFQ